eukprot:198568_1
MFTMSEKRGHKRTKNELEQENNDTLPTPNSKRRRKNERTSKQEKQIHDAESDTQSETDDGNSTPTHSPTPPSYSPKQQSKHAQIKNRNNRRSSHRHSSHRHSSHRHSSHRHSPRPHEQTQHGNNIYINLTHASNRYEPHYEPHYEPRRDPIKPTTYELTSDQQAFFMEPAYVWRGLWWAICFLIAGIVAVIGWEFHIGGCIAGFVLIGLAALVILFVGNKFVVFDEAKNEILLLTEYVFRNGSNTQYICAFRTLTSIYSLAHEHKTVTNKNENSGTPTTHTWKSYEIRVKCTTGDIAIFELKDNPHHLMDDLDRFFVYHYPE